jgi:hypothetical protein
MVICIFAHKGGQYCHYGSMLSCSVVIIQGATQEIGDAPLTLISQMQQCACHLLLNIASRTITRL